jgi:hypothetical protein
MTKLTFLLGLAALTCTGNLRSQSLDDAEVRLPYAELKKLLTPPAPSKAPDAPKPALLSARLQLSITEGNPVLNATFRAASFQENAALIPLLSGDVSLASQDPQDALVVIDQNSFCLSPRQAGVHTLHLRLLPVLQAGSFSLKLPACPSLIIESGDIPADHAVALTAGSHEQIIAGGQTIPLSPTGQDLEIHLLDRAQTADALRPPEPSTWSWQHQALVTPSEGELIYQIIALASASDGSGVEANLPIPADARDIEVRGEDLVSHTKVRSDGRSQALALVWKTRNVLDRQLLISYRMPLRPLARTWRLEAPGNAETRTRFIIATTPLLTYAADKLSAPLTSQNLPASLAELLNGGTSRILEGESTAELQVSRVPVAAIDDGLVRNAEWSLKIEPDGAMLTSGVLTIEHKAPLDFIFDTPENMKLLSCEVGGKAVAPVDLGKGRLMVSLPSQAESTRLSCAFTGKTEALDPVEGTARLTLPKLPLFIHSLIWRLQLPPGYQAETHGNLQRIASGGSEPPSHMTLVKNLCRDERPEIHAFYQRSDLNR